MNTPKTIEEYVLQELLDTKAKYQHAQNVNEMLYKEIQRYQETLERIKGLAKLRKTSDDDFYISFENKWEAYDPEDFELICELFGLKKEDVDA